MAEIPVLFTNKEDCCGCGACFSVCPVHAIRMVPDRMGFLYPEIDSAHCIGCGSCLRVCPVRKADEHSVASTGGRNG